MQKLKEKAQYIWQMHKKLFIFISFVLALMILILGSVALLTIQSSPPTVSTSQIPQQQQSNTSILRAPDVYFAHYTNKARLPKVPKTVNSYTLKQNFTPSEIRAIANKVGITSIEVADKQNFVGTNFTDKEKMDILTFNKLTGTFTFESYGEIKPASYQTGQLPQDEALAFLQELGVADRTVSCNTTYKTTSKLNDDVTYVECHRDTSNIQLPLISFIGVLNIPLTTPLSTLQSGQAISNLPNDPTIIQTNNGSDGKQRPNDFNTATVAITKTGVITNVVSNLRWIESQTQQVNTSIKTPQEALHEFSLHKAKLSLTLPSGSGDVEWEKVYQDNKAESKDATITDIALVYIENPVGNLQQTYEPMYIIRGYAMLTTGYSVNFVQTIPARIDNASSIVFHATEAVAGTSDSIQIGTFNPLSKIPSQTKTPLPNQPTPTPPAKEFCSSDHALSDRNITLHVPGYSDLTVAIGIAHVMYAQPTPGEQLDMSIVRNEFFKAVESQYVSSVAFLLTNNYKSSLASIHSQADVKAFFAQTNGGECNASNHASASIQSGIRYLPIPLYNCTSTQEYDFNVARMNQVTDNVASDIYTAIQQNTLDTYAKEPDRFPFYTLSNFQWVFGNGEIPDNLAQFKSCYISGFSPSIFFENYQGNITVSLPNYTVYTQPSAINNIWKVKVNAEGLLQVSEQATSHLYYEYNGEMVQLTTPQAGYVVVYDDWQNQVSKIAKTLMLNQQESDQLLLEVKNTLYGTIKTKYLKITFANENELNQKLPLIMSSQPQTLRRIHLLLTPLNTYQNIMGPKLVPITRNGFTAIEVGARIN